MSKTHHIVLLLIFGYTVSGFYYQIPPDGDNPPAKEPSREVTFIREASFGDTEEVFLDRIKEVEVDNKNRVYITELLGSRILIYNPDGSFLTSIGREGKGPGEFDNITDLKIDSSRILAADGNTSAYPLDLHVYSLGSLLFSHTQKIVPANVTRYKELQGFAPHKYYLRNDGRFLVQYRIPGTSPRVKEKTRDSDIKYYIQDENGYIISDDPVFEQQGLNFLYYTYPGGYTVGHHFPFMRRSLFLRSNDGYIYTAWTEEFSIKVYDRNFEYLGAIEHQIQKSKLNKSSIFGLYTSENEQRILKSNEDQIPDTWPAISKMIMDDENRLWVSRIDDNYKVREWWILDDGDLFAKFKWSINKTVLEVKNGFFYTLETEEKTGLQEVVRYRIEMK